MEWRDEAIILGVRRHGEGSVILEIMTPTRGRHMGLVRGGRSSRMRALLQPGNSVDVTWRARLDEHLGNFAIEADRLRAAMLMETPLALNGLQLLAAHMRLLPERDPHASLYRAALVILDNLHEPEIAARLLIRFELAILDELGFGLDLSRCAATGQTQDLAYVSPKTGRAVSREAGAPWAAKLLEMPAFLAPVAPTDQPPLDVQVRAGFSVSGHFLARHVWEPRGIRPPDARASFVNAVLRALSPVETPGNPV
ncbi:MAG TPA: DNA repair protein RecO [Rhizobiaceae bacterium]|nr:DNA repair protein RecO [Rhizobiaceae bacterium]